jgi:hypothetical protein
LRRSPERSQNLGKERDMAKKKADSLETAFAAALAAVPEADASKAVSRSQLAARVAHADAVRAAAQRDAGALLGTVVGDRAVTAHEVALLGRAVAEGRRLLTTPGAVGAGASAEAVAQLGDAALRKECRWIQRELAAAFRTRFVDNPAGLRRLKEIRVGASDEDLVADTEAFRALIESDAHAAWFAALPRNETALWARLLALTAEAARRFGIDQRALDQGVQRGRKEALGRALAVMFATERRVRVAGSYRFRGTATAKDYRGYTHKRPAKKK